MNSGSTIQSIWENRLRERIFFLDGAMGTQLQKAGLEAKDYHGTLFVHHPREIAGNHDVLKLTRPEITRNIQKSYLETGADIIETSTFNANRLSLSDYGLEAETGALNEAGARLSQEALRAHPAWNPGRAAYVAGVTNLDDEVVGTEARRLWEDARRMLDELEKNPDCLAHGVMAIFPAAADCDGIILYRDNDRRESL